MRLPTECYQIMKELEQHLPALDKYQLRGLAMWVCGTIFAGSGCQTTVATALSTAMGNFNSLRQYLREWAVRRARPLLAEPKSTGGR